MQSANSFYAKTIMGDRVVAGTLEVQDGSLVKLVREMDALQTRVARLEQSEREAASRNASTAQAAERADRAAALLTESLKGASGRCAAVPLGATFKLPMAGPAYLMGSVAATASTAPLQQLSLRVNITEQERVVFSGSVPLQGAFGGECAWQIPLSAHWETLGEEVRVAMSITPAPGTLRLAGAAFVVENPPQV